MMVWHDTGGLPDRTIEHALDGSSFVQNYHGWIMNGLTTAWKESRTGEFWVNVYGTGCDDITSNKTKDDADQNAKFEKMRIASATRLACVRVKWMEGEGL